MRQQREEPFLDHRAAPGDAEDLVVGGDPGAAQPLGAAPRTAGRCSGGGSVRRGRRGATARPARRGSRTARMPNSRSDLDDEPGDRRMQVHVLVRVDVVERSPVARNASNCARSPRRAAAARRRRKNQRIAGAEPIVVEPAVSPTSAGSSPGGSTGAPSTSTRCSPTRSAGSRRARVDRVGRRRRADHQAGAGQDTVAMRRLDRLVDRSVAAEIVGGNDQPLQRGPSAVAWRRNWKNSTPSRSRRRIICGLRSISPTSEAIFFAAEIEALIELLDDCRRSRYATDAGSAAARSAPRCRRSVRHVSMSSQPFSTAWR